MLSRSRHGLLLGLLAMLASPVHAVVVTFEYAGYVDIVDDDHGNLDGSIQLGTPFNASYTFKSTSPPGIVDPDGTWYFEALTSYSLRIGSYTVTGVGANSGILVIDYTEGRDHFIVVNRPRSLAGQQVTVDQHLLMGTSQALTSSDLPTVPPRLEDFETADFAVYNSAGSLGIHGILTTFTPEPSTLLLLAGAAWTVCGRPRRRQHGKLPQADSERSRRR